MQTDTVAYVIGDELDPLAVWWTASGTLVDFSAPHTFSATMFDIDALTTNVFGSAKTTGFTGAAGSGNQLIGGTPNLTVTWATSGELNAVTVPGLYVLQIVATRTADNRQRTAQIDLLMKARY